MSINLDDDDVNNVIKKIKKAKKLYNCEVQAVTDIIHSLCYLVL